MNNSIENQKSIQYKLAERRVKKIKRFYKHLTAYVAVNIFLVFVNISNLDSGESYFQFKNFITLTFWGIGILVHAFMVFGFGALFGNDWETQKIKKFMEEDEKFEYRKTNRWE